MLEQLTVDAALTGRTPAGAAVHSLAVDLPEGLLSSAEVAEDLGVDEDRILSRTVIRQRRVVAWGTNGG